MASLGAFPGAARGAPAPCDQDSPISGAIIISGAKNLRDIAYGR